MSLTLVLGMKIDWILWKEKKIQQKSSWKHPFGSQLIQRGKVLSCHIFGQQYLCPCGNKLKNFNKFKTCPSDKRLIRANGSAFSAKSVWICLNLWLWNSSFKECKNFSTGVNPKIWHLKAPYFHFSHQFCCTPWQHLPKEADVWTCSCRSTWEQKFSPNPILQILILPNPLAEPYWRQLISQSFQVIVLM